MTNWIWIEVDLWVPFDGNVLYLEYTFYNYFYGKKSEESYAS